MDPQLKRGLTDACVLALLSRGDSYGYKLVRDAAELMPLSDSTLYPVLRRLEEAGALGVYSQEHAGRLRRYYRITSQGRAQLAGFAREWEALGKVYTFIRQMEKENRIHQDMEAIKP
ncbi:MAG: PadR family transcriptional regulator [Eubacteriales bacterium]|jgi:PadR family transcriptional regulator PadR|nr:PadR family transcriptional regulator [Eubacteriales bacterium]MDD3572736.1 PadR family transcriptional regulator [Eubacteriales bacterium]MDD4134267.1 PadR family transcriptional regulator [Eubacteriales bacterium]NLO12547.1 PadR family transcriptional regulator [Clostridiales bacterium]